MLFLAVTLQWVAHRPTRGRDQVFQHSALFSLAKRLQRRDRAGDKGRLHLERRVVDRRAEAFVEDFHPEQLGRGSGAYSLAAAMVTSKGRIWSEYQGRAGSLKPWTSDKGRLSRSSTVALTGMATSQGI